MVSPSEAKIAPPPPFGFAAELLKNEQFISVASLLVSEMPPPSLERALLWRRIECSRTISQPVALSAPPLLVTRPPLPEEVQF